MTVILRESFTTLSSWSDLGGTSLVAGRNGTALQVSGTGGRAEYRFPADAESEYVTVGFAIKPASVSSAWLAHLESDGGATSHVTILTTAAGGFTVRRGASGTTLGTTVGDLYTTTTWAYVEIQARLHDTDGSVTIRVDGVERLALTGTDTRNGGTKTVFDGIQFFEPQFATILYDDLYVATGPGEPFRGDMAIGPEAQAVRQSLRVGVSEPHTPDQQRLARHSVRVAFQGAVTTVSVAALSTRVLYRPDGGNALLANEQARVLYRPDGGHAVLASARLAVLAVRSIEGVTAKFWDGSAYVAGPMMVWDGATWQPVEAVMIWNGTAWVPAI